MRKLRNATALQYKMTQGRSRPRCSYIQDQNQYVPWDCFQYFRFRVGSRWWWSGWWGAFSGISFVRLWEEVRWGTLKLGFSWVPHEFPPVVRLCAEGWGVRGPGGAEAAGGQLRAAGS